LWSSSGYSLSRQKFLTLLSLLWQRYRPGTRRLLSQRRRYPDRSGGADEFQKVLTPTAVEATEQAMQQLEADHDAALGQWRLAVEHARYESRMCRTPISRGGTGKQASGAREQTVAVLREHRMVHTTSSMPRPTTSETVGTIRTNAVQRAAFRSGHRSDRCIAKRSKGCPKRHTVSAARTGWTFVLSCSAKKWRTAARERLGELSMR